TRRGGPHGLAAVLVEEPHQQRPEERQPADADEGGDRGGEVGDEHHRALVAADGRGSAGAGLLGIAGLLPVAGLPGVTGLLLPVTRLLLPVAGLLGASGLLGRVTGRVVGIGLLGHGGVLSSRAHGTVTKSISSSTLASSVGSRSL